VSHVSQKAFDLESWNFTGMLISMCSCAPGYFCVDIFSIFRVTALDLVKICNSQLVSHISQKVFDLESLNLTGMLLSMCSCAPKVLLVDLVCFVKSYCPCPSKYLQFSICVTCSSKSIWPRVMKLYRNVDQHV
jgi:hypothetical protein